MIVLLAAFSAYAADDSDLARLPAPASRQVDFVRDVQPIFKASCCACHGESKQKSDYRLDSKVSALAGGAIGGAIVPGDSAKSLLIHYVAGLDEDMQMPSEGKPLTTEQIAILRAWIDQGAIWPDSADAKPADRRDHWSLKPLARPAVPGPKNAASVRNPIDAFVLAKLEEKGRAPAEAADKRTLLRRVYFDLIGLPPTPEDLDAFIADNSPEAYETVVDRLLASPRYGERWARHWMDVVHFAETHGHDEDKPRGNAWPYRDYLIQSFNADKPYGKFVCEQLAGDVLFPDDPQATVATGFIAAGPWDESSQMGILDDTVDKKIARYLDRDDMVATTMSTFVSATVHCARCHNHKFDPFSQAEYYSLQAVFAGVDRCDRPYGDTPAVRQARTSLLKQKQRLEAGGDGLKELLLSEDARREVVLWEASAGKLDHWTALDPASVVSSGGQTSARQPDGSFLFSGPRPEVDTYTVVAPAGQNGITGVKLELLSDPSLPHGGPGRQDNGNLHLSEFQVFAAPLADAAAKKPVVLKSASADFDQQDWTVAMSLDGKGETAWGIYPQVGKTHWAVYEFKEPLKIDGGASLSFVLEQNHGRGHLIGRLRISVTNSAPPLGARAVPERIAAILATPSPNRTEADRIELATFVLKLRTAEHLAALPKPKMVYAAASDFEPQGNFKPAKTPRIVNLLRRGDINNPEQAAEPGALSCVPGLEPRFKLTHPNNEGERRAALARWITDPANVLTWRSIVNRAWHYHFGRGIVATPNDFGRMGAAPTHPELLDWLAGWFLEHGGSIKQLDRLIVTSATYRQSSRHQPELAKLDADNQFLWRMNRSRLDAESVRDAVLQISGKLDLTMGGPSVRQFIEKPGIHATPDVDYVNFDVDSPASYRRSVYRFLFRTLPDPFMDSLDCADASQLTPARNASVTALQSLTMLNNHFIVRQSEHLAARLSKMSGEPNGQIAALYRLALGRLPTEREAAALATYAAKHGMANTCRLVLNSNEFIFVQ